MTMQDDEHQDRQLWCAVLSQAIADATSLRTSREAQREQRAAMKWLLTDTIDFPTVCTLAGLEPEAVRDRFMRMPGVVEKFAERPFNRTPPSAQELTELEFFPHGR